MVLDDSNDRSENLLGMMIPEFDKGFFISRSRGLDKIMTDATGATYLPGGTQRLDGRWGKVFIRKFHGRIVDGVLTTS